MLFITLRHATGKPELFLRTRTPFAVARIMAKAEQLGLFGNKREEIKNPGRVTKADDLERKG